MCDNDDSLTGVCVHKNVFPMDGFEFCGCILTFIVLFIANCGGVGGGGALIPVVLVFYGFDMKESIAQSNASILVSSIARYLYNFNKPHPLKEGKGVLVDYNIASLMLPMITVGATIGVMLNKILPGVVCASLLTVVLIIFTVTTVQKLMRINRDERQKYGPVVGPVCGKKR